jgi:bacterioferritin-associated ferredoxin
MYVCLCNALTDRDIRRVAGPADGSVAQVYRALGCAPRCGQCVPVVREMLDDGPSLGSGTTIKP